MEGGCRPRSPGVFHSVQLRENTQPVDIAPVGPHGVRLHVRAVAGAAAGESRRRRQRNRGAPLLHLDSPQQRRRQWREAPLRSAAASSAGLEDAGKEKKSPPRRRSHSMQIRPSLLDIILLLGSEDSYSLSVEFCFELPPLKAMLLAKLVGAKWCNERRRLSNTYIASKVMKKISEKPVGLWVRSRATRRLL